MKNVRSALRLLALAILVGLLLGILVPRLTAAEEGVENPRVHVVEAGETLWDLAGRFESGADPRSFIYELQRLNGLEDSRIFPGQRLILPSG